VTKFVAAEHRPSLGTHDAPAPAGCHASASGIAQCLRMLADEAGSLDLPCTARALWAAIAVCEREADLRRLV
jgi:hypothetical protein